MKAHITKEEQEKFIQSEMEKTLTRVKTISMKQGMRAALGVILDKTKQEDKNIQEILDDIKSYCEKALGVVNAD